METDAALALSRRIARVLLGPPQERAIRVEYWDGSSDPPPNAASCLRLAWPGAFRRMLLPPTNRSVGEAYVRGDIDLVGDVEAAVRSGWTRLESLKRPRERARLFALLMRLPARPRRGGHVSPARTKPRVGSHRAARGDAGAVRFHYDVGNEFFRLFLDERMQYSCAYFRSADMSLEEAQAAKLDLICKKLRLKPGERFLDVGCGWGGLVAHATQHFGVHSVGITLSPAQATWARRYIKQLGLADRCSIEVMDYRDLGQAAPFDKAASVGMIEHVGLRRYSTYFHAVRRALRPDGVFLNHGIVNLRWGHTVRGRIRQRIGRRHSFIHRHIFPSSDLVPAGHTLARAERAGFEVHDVESLREHYAWTLRHWLNRLEDRWDAAVAEVGEATTRAWRFYMGACAHLFAAGHMGIVQSILSVPQPRDRRDAPATREDLYADEIAPTPRSEGFQAPDGAPAQSRSTT